MIKQLSILIPYINPTLKELLTKYAYIPNKNDFNLQSIVITIE